MVQRNQQVLKKEQSYIKAPANLCDDRMKFIEALITFLFSSPPHLVSSKKFSACVYWKVFCHFWPIKLCDLPHVVLAAPVFLGIFFYHFFYGMTLRFLSNQGEGVHF